jgi:membrane protease YdiL (CAAX protease family)
MKRFVKRWPVAAGSVPRSSHGVELQKRRSPSIARLSADMSTIIDAQKQDQIRDQEVDRPLDRRRIALFILFAYGIAWALYAVVYATGGLIDSPALVPDTPVTLAFVLLIVSMWAPALANMLTRAITGEGRRDLWLRPRLRHGWPYWLLMWFLPALLAAIGAVIYFVLFAEQFDPTMSTFSEQVEAMTGEATPVPTTALLTLQVVQAILLTPIINAFATFGEEFGWRGYLQQKLMPLGVRRAMLAMGLIWGAWHWPVIAMGHNFGLDYSGHPWLGILAMIWFTFTVGTVLGWAVLRAGSVWPAVIGHAALNGTAGLGVLFLAGDGYLLLGPTPVGLFGGIGWSVLALFLLWRGFPSSRKTDR